MGDTHIPEPTPEPVGAIQRMGETARDLIADTREVITVRDHLPWPVVLALMAMPVAIALSGNVLTIIVGLIAWAVVMLHVAPSRP